MPQKLHLSRFRKNLEIRVKTRPAPSGNTVIVPRNKQSAADKRQYRQAKFRRTLRRYLPPRGCVQSGNRRVHLSVANLSARVNRREGLRNQSSFGRPPADDFRMKHRPPRRRCEQLPERLKRKAGDCLHPVLPCTSPHLPCSREPTARSHHPGRSQCRCWR